MHRMWNLHGTVPQPRYQRQWHRKDHWKMHTMWKMYMVMSNRKIRIFIGIIVHIATFFYKQAVKSINDPYHPGNHIH